MRELKKGFGGAYTVLEDGKPVGEPFTGPGAKARAEAEVARVAPPLPAPVARDDDEAVASIEAPLPGQPVSNLTPFERETLARQAEERRRFLALERQRKENDLRTERDLAVLNGVLAEKVKAVIADHFKDDPTAEDVVASMMRAIEPVLAAGKMGARRERRLYAAVPKRAA